MEALRINYTKDNILNSKNEYLKNCITRLTVEEDDWQRKERDMLKETQEQLEKSQNRRSLMSRSPRLQPSWTTYQAMWRECPTRWRNYPAMMTFPANCRERFC